MGALRKPSLTTISEVPHSPRHLSFGCFDVDESGHLEQRVGQHGAWRATEHGPDGAHESGLPSRGRPAPAVRFTRRAASLLAE